MRVPSAVLVALALWGVPADAAEPLVWQDAAVAEVTAEGLRLEDGREVVLAGLLLPAPEDDTGTRLKRQARNLLVELIGDRPVRLGAGAVARDRYGRMLAQVETASGLWVQGELVRLGLARVALRPDQRARADDLLALEEEARGAGRGLWALARYRPRAPDQLDGLIGSFQLIEGAILAQSTQRRYVYLDFGPNWRTDFSVRVRRGDARRLLPDRAEALVGRKVRVRGWVFRGFGPSIELTHPEQLEVLE